MVRNTAFLLASMFILHMGLCTVWMCEAFPTFPRFLLPPRSQLEYGGCLCTYIVVQHTRKRKVEVCEQSGATQSVAREMLSNSPF
jgi:hypothetical protein